MPSLAQLFRNGLNNTIFRRLGETAWIDGKGHAGAFYNRPQEVQISDGTLVGLELSFHCNYTKQVAELVENDPIEIEVKGDGTKECYRFRRRIPHRGDESGRVILELMK